MKTGGLVATLAFVLALLFVMAVNVTEEQREVVTHDFVADITPVVEYTPVEGWTSFNPSGNWTGWGPVGDYGYTATQTPNKYKLPQIRLDEETDTLTAEQIDALAWAAIQWDPGFAQSNYNFPLVVDSPQGAYGNSTVDRWTFTQEDDLYRLSLSAIVTPSDKDIELVFSNDVLVALPGGGIDYGTFVDIVVDDGLGFADTMSYSAKSASWIGYLDGTAQFSIELSASTDILLYKGGVEISKAPVTGGSSDGFSNEVVGDGCPSPGETTIKTFQLSAANYIDVTRGITIESGDTATVTNGYVNGSAEFLVIGNGANASIGGVVTVYTGNLGGAISAIINANVYQLGTWPAVLVELDAIDDMIRLTPVLAFDNFLSYTASEFSVEVPMDLDPEESFSVSCTLGTLSIGLVETMVETDPEGILWDDPVISPQTYFPEVTAGPYQVVLRSFAAYGSSLTINGQSFAVTDRQITVGSDSYPVAGMTIDYGDTVVLGFPNARNSPTVDLGAVSSRNITGEGTWYMQVDLRDTETVTKTDVVYDPDGWTSATGPQILLVFLGFNVVGLLVASHMGRVGASDVAVVLACIVLGLMVLGAVS